MKIETVAQFLARGGTITKIPAKTEEVKVESVKSNNAPAGVASIISMDDVDLYYGEKKKTKVKKKSVAPTIDISALPPELKAKYVDGVLNDNEKDEN